MKKRKQKHWKFRLKKKKAVCDNKVFRELENKEITIEEALKTFKNNNEIYDEITIPEFKLWLRGLGWRV